MRKSTIYRWNVWDLSNVNYASLQVNNEDTEEKSKIFEEIQTLALAEKDLKEKLELYANNDPELFQNKKDDTKVCFFFVFNEAFN